MQNCPPDSLKIGYQGADELICDVFAAVEIACRQEGVPFAFEAEDVE
jgi:hypothetical protein